MWVILLSTIILFFQNDVLAAAITATEKAKTQMDAHLSGGEKLIDYITRARISIFHKKKAEAERILASAIADIHSLDKENELMKVIILEYGDSLLPKDLILPLKREDITLDSLKQTMYPVRKRKTKIYQAKIQLIHIDADNAKVILQRLGRIKGYVEKDNNYLADFLLGRLQSKIVQGMKGHDLDDIQLARDNIVLARALIEDRQYDAANNAIEYTKGEFLDEDGKLHGNKMEEARDQLSLVSEEIKRRNPKLIKKIDMSLKRSWEGLSTGMPEDLKVTICFKDSYQCY